MSDSESGQFVFNRGYSRCAISRHHSAEPKQERVMKGRVPSSFEDTVV